MSREEEGDDYGGPYYNQPDLGDLSRGLAHERGETWSQEARGRVPPAQPGGPSQVADQARGTSIIADLQRDPVAQVAPALAFQVQATYDSRPIQGYDFQASGCNLVSFIDGGGGETTFDPVEFTYLVPDNTIAVLKAFQYRIINGPVNAITEGGCYLGSTLFVDDLPVREYTRMRHPQYMLERFPAFVIADERTTIKLTLFHLDPADNVLNTEIEDLNAPVLFNFYGNIILKTGIPKEFEIANKIY